MKNLIANAFEFFAFFCYAHAGKRCYIILLVSSGFELTIRVVIITFHYLQLLQLICIYMQINLCKYVCNIFKNTQISYEVRNWVSSSIKLPTGLYLNCIASLEVELTTCECISEIACARQSDEYINLISEVLAIHKYSLRKCSSASAAAHLHLIIIVAYVYTYIIYTIYTP